MTTFTRTTADGAAAAGRGTDPRDRAEAAAVEPADTPTADCVADSTGGLTFDMAARTRPGAAGARDAALVLCRRGGTAAHDEVRLPLVPAGDGRLRAVLPNIVPLPEGRWDAFAAIGDGEAHRLAPGVNDLRSLVDRRPWSDRCTVAVRIPYATKHGNLSVRSWLRVPHAEAGEIQVREGAVGVRGLLFGAELGPGAVAEARRRKPSGARTLPVPVTGSGARFAFDLGCAGPAAAWQAGTEVWDLWLRPSARAEPVRIARLLDDVPDRKHIFSYPSQPCPGAEGPLRAAPYYTTDNNLAVRISPGT